jgi:membrane-anchored glycerophosphoryl diester phosphodiesterase (GDPDase)
MSLFDQLFTSSTFLRVFEHTLPRNARHFPIVKGLYIVFYVFLRMPTEWNGMNGFPPMQIHVMDG